ncbi:MAG: hypothetical protein WDW36_008974 [Sanguina aurantia]
MIGSGRSSLRVVCAAGSEKMTVSITGATGLVGSRLASKLASQGHKVRVLARDVGKARSKLPYPGLEFFAPGQWSQAIAGSTGIANLAGEPIATRWTPELKATIKSSRVNVTKSLVEAIRATPANLRPKVLVSSSAVGFYGTSNTSTFNDDSPSGSDYLSQVCREWEAAATEAEALGVRVCLMRTGIVLAREGGALGKMLPVFQVFAGGPLGTGKQWMSWIHRDDLVAMFIEALQNPAYSGPYNATAPKPVRMNELCGAIGSILGRPSWLPVPDFALQSLLGEGATVVLDGQRVLPTKIQGAGFSYKFPEVSSALESLLK